MRVTLPSWRPSGRAIKLKDVQEAATAAKKGMWGGDNPRALEAKFGGKPIPAIVENVRDGSTVSFPPA